MVRRWNFKSTILNGETWIGATESSDGRYVNFSDYNDLKNKILAQIYEFKGDDSINLNKLPESIEKIVRLLEG